MQDRAELKLDRLAGAAALEVPGVESPLAARTLLSQVVSELGSVNTQRLRQPVGAVKRCFTVQYTSERVLGTDGPYRQFFGDIVKAMEWQPRPSFKAAAPLLVPCPNAQASEGDNRDLFMFAPSARSARDLRFFEVLPLAALVVVVPRLTAWQLQILGRIMGCALRTGVLMPFRLPLLVWKSLVGQEANLSDLEAVDHQLVHSLLLPLQQCETEDAFQATFGGELSWYEAMRLRQCSLFAILYTILTTIVCRDIGLCDGSVVDVRSDGAPRRAPHHQTVYDGDVERKGYEGSTLPLYPPDSEVVSFADKDRFCSRVQRACIHQQQAQLKAVAAGLGQVVPRAWLRLFTWKQLEHMLCGASDIDLELLARHTTYGFGLSQDDAHVKYFWQVLGEFTHEQRRRFVKFAFAQVRVATSCGSTVCHTFDGTQERLPGSDADFVANNVRMLIQRPTSEVATQAQIDNSFPTADTCFFNVKLPLYSSLAAARRMLTALVELKAWGLDADDVRL